ncbi:hypothetical protein L5515_010188 [Caenorhabditis briggsae]|uniref:Uncharacterized protein n=1 Tax=Caenorhabditis briggsae TaxID=6238 RepID=A0AAE9ESX9_CAEBR|nr:hypothetical protein L5515_010188 [Caenorhabditis briggsae]
MLVALVEITAWVNVVAFFAMLFTNAELVKLIFSDASRNFRNYTVLMMANVANLVVFSCLQMILNPIISIERNVLYVFSTIKPQFMSKTAVRVLLALYGMTYCMALLLCAVKFVFRYDRVCRCGKLFRLKKHLVAWFSFILLAGLFWGACIFQIARETPYVDDIIRGPLLINYNVSLENTTYTAAVYEVNDPITGRCEWNQSGIVMGVSFVLIIVSVMVTMVFCISKLSKTLRELVDGVNADGDKKDAEKTKVQRELFSAQRIQSVFPFIFICVPIVSVLVLPIFRINGNIGISLSSIMVSVYPVIDPIVLIFSITPFRNAVFGRQHNYNGMA